MSRKIVIVVFSLLSAAFLFRFVQFGYKWLSGASSPEFNYKALTAWSAVYVVVCAAVAWTTAKLGKSEDT
ncbi:MAG TPA: hypothetical protein VFT72_01800 [Opitutaceae bacterium]|nr:hypothetical protein [Opitutaceae bacterium]